MPQQDHYRGYGNANNVHKSSTKPSVSGLDEKAYYTYVMAGIAALRAVILVNRESRERLLFDSEQDMIKKGKGTHSAE